MGKGSHLGDLEELILLAVARLGEKADGAGVRDTLSELAGRAVSISTVYVTLMRLEEKGHVNSWKGEPTASRGGKARRLYELTVAGRAALESTKQTRDRMWEGVAFPAAGSDG